MQVLKHEIEAIEGALRVLAGDRFEALSESEKNTVLTADAALVDIYRRWKKSNEKTAKYVAHKRTTNKRYGRGVGYIKKRDRAKEGNK
jgi:hypothetical protein